MYAFKGLFLRSMYKMGMFFLFFFWGGGAKISNIFWGMPDILLG